MTTEVSTSIVRDYFESLGITGTKEEERFWEDVHAADPLLAEKMDLLITNRSISKNHMIYEVKNETLPFSLAFASYTGDLHRNYGAWIADKALKPQRILEIGCDNGLLACLYARLYPKAEVVGIDQSKAGIACAEELAAHLGLENVTFHCVDFTEIGNIFPTGHFDLITSVRCFHEIMGPTPIPQYWKLEDYLTEQPTFGPKDYLSIITSLLSETGLYLSCERLENPANTGQWANMLQEAGLYIQWDESDVISFHELDAFKKAPVIIATKYDTGMTTMEGMEKLYTREKNLSKLPGCSLTGAAAEFLYNQFKNTAFQSGTIIDFTDHWYVFRFEIWETTDVLLAYGYGNMGHRHLDILPKDAWREAEEKRNEFLSQYGDYGEVYHYSSLEDRPL
ncbi:hypothetical protein IEQ_00735 [Bacillus cereus BAG6X1-2]|nr:hypothetical protein IEQ_00735 [Bacillus cereus BAG6X1-2]